jgi:membrane protein
MTITVSQAKDLLFKSWNEFNEDQAPRLGAALAYYTELSLAPHMILLIAISGLDLCKEAVQGQLFGQINSMVGAEGAKAIEGMIAGASKPSSGVIASIIGFLTLIFGASSVAGELKASLNVVWDHTDAEAGIVDIVKDRSKSLGVVLAGGFLLLVSLVVSSMIAAAGSYIGGVLPLPEIVLHALNFIVSIAVVAGVFAVLFKYLPDVKIEWHDVAIGALFTAILFTIGKFLIGMYLGKASFGSTYGAAGSLVIVLVWVYYSAQIFFFGAEFTQVYAREIGSDPLKHRNRREPGTRERTARDTQPATHEQVPVEFTESATGQTTGAVGAVGSVLGGALVLSRIVSLFRGRRSNDS